MTYSKALATKYATNRDQYTSSDYAVTPILKKIGIKDKTILDFGCGDGPETEKFIAMKAKRVVGVDSSGEMIRRAKMRKISKTSFLKISGKKLPLKNHEFDLVYSRYVLHYVKDLNFLCKEISRVLKSKGYFVALLQCLTDNPKCINKLVPINLGKGKGVTKIEILSKSTDEVREALEKAGLKILKFTEVTNTDSSIDPKYPNKHQFKNSTYVLFTQKITK